jgi:hypothetical protein
MQGYITYHSHLRYSYNYLAISYTADVVSPSHPLVAFYDIHQRKREVLFFYFVPATTPHHITSREDYIIINNNIMFGVQNMTALNLTWILYLCCEHKYDFQIIMRLMCHVSRCRVIFIN